MIGTIHVMEINYRRALSYRKEELDGKLSVKDERMAKIERNGTLFVRDGIILAVAK